MSIVVPRQFGIELRVQMHERLLQRVETANPHFRGRERVHPENEAGAIGIGIGLEAQFGDLVGVVSSALNLVLSGRRDDLASAAAMVLALSATCLSGPGP